MTKDELIKHFSQHKYDYIRRYVNRIMNESPDVTDWFWLCSAGDLMDECAVDGVDLSVDDALRLTRNDREVPLSDIIKKLDEAGITDKKFVDTILNAKVERPDFTGCEADQDAVRRVHEMTMLAFRLTKNNKDIVLIGRPKIARNSSSSRLALALVCEDLSEDEQETLTKLYELCDDKRMFQEESYIKLVFFVDNIWITE